MTKKKNRYLPPADKVEKLTLIGVTGYISANEGRLLAREIWDGGGRKKSSKKYTPS